MDRTARIAAAPLPPGLAAALPYARSLVGVELFDGSRVDLHVVEHGNPGGRPVLLLHGNRSWAVTWRHVMRLLPELRLLAVDLPGFGLSSALPEGRRTICGSGEAIARLVERLELEDAVVVAHEAGALIAAAADERLRSEDRGRSGEATRGAPSRHPFAGAVLIATTPFPATDGSAPSTLHRFGAGLELRDAAFIATGLPRLALDALQANRSSFGEAAALYAWPLSTSPRRHTLVEMAALAADDGARRTTAAWLRDFAGPLSLVWGHRDPLTTPSDLATQERELPYAHIVRTEAGHFVQEEEPERIADALRWTVEHAGRPADDLKIPENFLPGLGSGDYLEVGRAQVRRLVEVAGLRPGDRVLDVGCGLGRTARALTEVLSPAGRYDGIDVVRDVVRWCQQNLTRADPRLRFHHAAVESGLYSPGAGVDAREYRFPFSDASFDFVVAESLFTHLAAAEARHYLSEIGRVLRPGGIACVSAFLLDAVSRAAIEGGRSDHRFAVARGDDWIDDPDQPLLAVAFEAEWFRRALADAGLEPTRPVADGAWRGVGVPLSYQDMVVARRRSAPPVG
jgi:pimeloyl-ACP methyl ester carboxylesterase/SAM-dependent methyltransferase